MLRRDSSREFVWHSAEWTVSDNYRIPAGIKQVDHEWGSVKSKLAQRNDLPLTDVSQFHQLETYQSLIYLDAMHDLCILKKNH